MKSRNRVYQENKPPSCHFSILPLPQGNYYSSFPHHRFVQPIYEYHINGNPQYVLFSVWLLSFKLCFQDSSILLYVKSSPFIFDAIQHPIVCIYLINLSILFSVTFGVLAFLLGISRSRSRKSIMGFAYVQLQEKLPQFFKVLVPIHNSTSSIWEFSLLHVQHNTWHHQVFFLF